MKLFTSLLILFLSILNLPAYTADLPYNITSYNISNGILHTDVLSVYQDEVGFIWLGTRAGLQRYDGHSFKNFTIKNSVNTKGQRNRIRLVTKGNAENTLWLVTEAGLFEFDKYTGDSKPIIFKGKNFPNHPTSVVNLGKGLCVVAAKNGLFEIEINQQSQVVKQKLISPIYINSLKKDEKGRVWVLTNIGLHLYDYSKGKLVRVNLGSHTKRVFQKAYYHKGKGLLMGGRGFMIQLPSSEMDLLDIQTEKVQYVYYPLQEKDNGVSAIMADFKGNYWVGTQKGLLKFSESLKLIDSYKTNKSFKKLSKYLISNIYLDKTGGLWVGTIGGGASFIDLNQKGFQTLSQSILNRLPNNNFRAICKDDSGNLWIGTNDGLFKVNSKTFQITSFTIDKNRKDALCHQSIRCLLKDKFNRIWVGTDQGISIYLGGDKFYNIPTEPNNEQKLSHNQIYDISEDKFGTIWAGSWAKGLNKIQNAKNPSKITVEHIFKGSSLKHQLTSNAITAVASSKEYSDLFVGTKDGLNRIQLDDKGKVMAVQHIFADTVYSGLKSGFIMSLKRQDEKTLWVGTIGGGLHKFVFEQDNYKIKSFQNHLSEQAYDIESIQVDKNNNLWLGGRGLYFFDTQKETFINFNKKDGLMTESFKPHVTYKEEDNTLWFGGIDGLNYFKPSDITRNDTKPEINFTDLLINNEYIIPQRSYSGTVILPEHLSLLEHLNLAYNENNFQIGFSTFHFTNKDKIFYEYKLEGIYDNWVRTNVANLQFSQLAVGEYKLQIRANNGEGVWSDTQTLAISVLPPWWKSPFAKKIYFVLGILSLMLSYYLMSLRYKAKRNEELQKMAYEQGEKINKIRIDFFTNISHEFRTPLTLILANIHKLYADKDNFSPEVRTQLLDIYNSSSQLNKLITELLDFRKIETGHFKLYVSKTDVPAFTTDCINQFNTLSEEKNISFQKEINFESQEQWADTKVLQKVLYNILSNAFKYTESGGDISFYATDQSQEIKSSLAHSIVIGERMPDTNYYTFSIKDNGKGIREEALPHIFDSYFRGGEAEKSQNIGYGVGLALVKSLVEAHQGMIHVFSEKGVGTEIMISIPNSTDYLDESQVLEASQQEWLPDEEETVVFEEIDEIQLEEEAKEEKDKVIMIVEDNLKMQQFLKQHFSKRFQVLTASNGKEALAEIDNKYPNIILSDIMMPEMDGIEMVGILKERKDTNHIPIVMLTAKDNEAERIKAAKLGVETFIGKPFNLELLDIKVNQILGARKELKQKFKQDIFVEAKEQADNKSEKEFLEAFTKVIEENISRPNLTVDHICRSLGISRTNLYRKVKVVTGCSINQFIRQAKMRKAAILIASENISIQEVMERVGFQSPSYFTRAFKKEYGMPPTKFIEQMEKSGRDKEEVLNELITN